MQKFKRQQFPRSFSRHQLATGGRGSYHQGKWHRGSHRFSWCLSSTETMSVVVFSVFGTSKVNHKAQSCRQPSFVHSPLSEVLTPEVGYREWVITWLHTHYMHVSVQQVDWVGSSSCWGCTVMALHSPTAIKDRFAPQLENSVSCFRWPRTQQDGCQDTFEKEYTQQNEHHMVLNYFSEKKKRGVGRRRNAFWQEV